MEQRFDTAICVVCDRLREKLESVPEIIKKQTHEIRMRAGGPLILITANAFYFINEGKMPSFLPGPQTVPVTREDLQESFARLCDYSVYAYQDEIKNGYITYCGGHRVGLCGTAVTEGDRIINLRDISSLNIRVARQIYGVSSDLIGRLGSKLTQGLLIVGPPACGKTTLLRDLCRQLSQGVLGKMRKICIIDERGELAATYCGESQNDLGPCCDVLDGYPKGEGMIQAIRCLSPQIIVCDELGSDAEIAAIKQGLNAGVSVISTMHAGSLEQLLQRPQAVELLHTGAFPWVAMMDNTGEFGKITDISKAGDLLGQMGRHFDPAPDVGDGRVYRVL